MNSRTRALRIGAGVTALVAAGAALTGCSSTASGGGDADKTTGVTISVVLAVDPPPKATLDQFTKDTGITVKWSNVDWDSLQTKIAAAATAKTYFADATDVDWSRVGQLAKLKWFHPMQDYLNVSKLKGDMPQLASFTDDGQTVGIPFDASYMVTTVNKKMFADAGITTMPTTIDEYTADLKKVQAGGVQYPLNIPFAASEGLSTYWYETTGAFGGKVLDGAGKPQFTSKSSPGYKAAEWMIGALKDGLVAPANINVSDSQGMQTLMAKGAAASIFSDYSGNVGSLYNVPSSSTVTGQVEYIPTPGVDGVGPNLTNADGIGIPMTAKYPKAAATFIKWFTSTDAQAGFAGADGPSKVLPSYALPSRLSAVDVLNKKGSLDGGDVLATLLKDSKPVFPDGAPSWYPEFSRAVYTNLHAAAAGTMTVDQAIKKIADTANQLASGS
ncbi:sugar ABC transporter substrate-binding protein [Pseudolysinimonas kribbensis]|uniref:Sugar ABC transporter substrate-binding protein n=1 Tax=Pseudolysinimonas kribbensis TaxID=433641 RepID=A0ABQ6K471_9MICO|nr:extracellular solute-binding protein [Pseudolysinimonas kribbensis]GMA94501.1 sugar ABC transporter substrate-binding protein [Pseudolysinimonas kribbensis]